MSIVEAGPRIGRQRRGVASGSRALVAILIASFTLLLSTTEAVVLAPHLAPAHAAGSYAVDDYPDRDATDCSGTFGVYSWCKGGTWLSPRRFAYRNCTDFVAWRLGRTYGSLKFPLDSQGNPDGNARGWKQGAVNSGYQTGSTPVVGSVAWWGTEVGHGFGHIAIVTHAFGDGTATVEQYNKAGRGEYSNPTAAVRPDAYLYIGVNPSSGGGGGGAASTRIGALVNGTALVKDGGLEAPWVTQYHGVKQLLVTTARIGVLTTDGSLLVKEGGLGAQWVTELTGVSSFSLAGNRIGAVTGGSALVKEGDLGAQWVTEYDSAKQVALTPNRIGVVTTNGVALVKEGDLGAQWVTEYDGAGRLSLAGNRIGVLTTSGSALVKEGTLGAPWVTEYNGVKQLALTADRIGALSTSGAALVKEGGLGAQWVTEFTGAGGLVLSGMRIGVVAVGGAALAKEGDLGAPWLTEYRRVSALTLSNLG